MERMAVYDELAQYVIDGNLDFAVEGPVHLLEKGALRHLPCKGPDTGQGPAGGGYCLGPHSFRKAIILALS